MFDWIIPGGSVIVAAGVGWLTYKVSHRSTDIDEAQSLFQSSRQLSDDYKEAYESLKVEINSLRGEVADLREEVQALIREGEMWRGVAVTAFIEEKRKTGVIPFWWPTTEPHPEDA